MEHLSHYLILLLSGLGSLMVYRKKLKSSAFSILTILILGIFLVHSGYIPFNTVAHSQLDSGAVHTCCLTQPLTLTSIFNLQQPYYSYLFINSQTEILQFFEVRATNHSRSPPFFLFS